jgi:hypothetical protein
MSALEGSLEGNADSSYRSFPSPVTVKIPSIHLISEDDAARINVPKEVRRLGSAATSLFATLAALADLGSHEAAGALQSMRSVLAKAGKGSAADVLARLEASGWLPVNLHRGARWKLDAFGVVALQLLVVLQAIKESPRKYGDRYDSIPELDRRSAKDCWGCARWILQEYWQAALSDARLRNCVAPSYRAKADSHQHDITRKVRARFIAMLFDSEAVAGKT